VFLSKEEHTERSPSDEFKRFLSPIQLRGNWEIQPRENGKLARMRVPKLVCEMSYASGFVWFPRVDGGLRGE
jgi:hypothetical protein